MIYFDIFCMMNILMCLTYFNDPFPGEDHQLHSMADEELEMSAASPAKARDDPIEDPMMDWFIRCLKKGQRIPVEILHFNQFI